MNTENRIHLSRGASSARSWSKYQKTDGSWTLCGIRRVPNGRTGEPSIASEDHRMVNCIFCLQLMAPSGKAVAKRRVA
jgi:hypothetical protein